MGKFCGECGSPIDPTTGLCTNCGLEGTTYDQNTEETPAAPTYETEQTDTLQEDTVQTEAYNETYEPAASFTATPEPPAPLLPKLSKEEKKEAWKDAKAKYKEDKKEKKKNTPKKKRTQRALIKLLILIIIIGLLGVGIFFSVKGLFPADEKEEGNTTTTETSVTEPATEAVTTDGETPEPTTENTAPATTSEPPDWEMPEDYEINLPDAEQYLDENAEEIVFEEDASKGGSTEAQVYKNFADRGFKDIVITTTYSADGDYIGTTEISDKGTDKHPMYTAYYITEAGYAWMLYEINGQVFAVPLSYMDETSATVTVIFSETDTVTSYDSVLHKFFETKPKADAADVKVIGKIDAEALDKLTKKEINKL